MVKRTRIVEVVDYDPDWKIVFERISSMLHSHLEGLILGIEHVGSTSVEGLCAKPIIDIDVVIESYELFDKVKERLEECGYFHQGDLGIEGRQAFDRSFDDGFMRYNMYVCPKDGKGYLEHIALRDYLRSHPDARDEYGRLKKELARKHRFEIDSYLYGKTKFIRSILERTIYSKA